MVVVLTLDVLFDDLLPHDGREIGLLLRTQLALLEMLLQTRLFELPLEFGLKHGMGKPTYGMFTPKTEVWVFFTVALPVDLLYLGDLLIRVPIGLIPLSEHNTSIEVLVPSGFSATKQPPEALE